MISCPQETHACVCFTHATPAKHWLLGGCMCERTDREKLLRFSGRSTMTERYSHQHSRAVCVCVYVCVSTVSHDLLEEKRPCLVTLVIRVAAAAPRYPACRAEGSTVRLQLQPLSIPLLLSSKEKNLIFKARGEKPQLMSRINIILLYLSFVQCNYNTNM